MKQTEMLNKIQEYFTFEKLTTDFLDGLSVQLPSQQALKVVGALKIL